MIWILLEALARNDFVHNVDGCVIIESFKVSKPGDLDEEVFDQSDILTVGAIF